VVEKAESRLDVRGTAPVDVEVATDGDLGRLPLDL